MLTLAHIQSGCQFLVRTRKLVPSFSELGTPDTIPIQPCHKSGISSPECHEIKGVDGELLSRVKLEQADTHAGIKPAYWIISNCREDARPAKRNAPSNLTWFTSYHLARPSAYLVPITAGTFQLPPSPTLAPGPRLATRDNLNASTYVDRLSSPHTYQDVSTGSSELVIPGTRYQSGLPQIRYYVPGIQVKCNHVGF